MNISSSLLNLNTVLNLPTCKTSFFYIITISPLGKDTWHKMEVEESQWSGPGQLNLKPCIKWEFFLKKKCFAGSRPTSVEVWRNGQYNLQLVNAISKFGRLCMEFGIHMTHNSHSYIIIPRKLMKNGNSNNSRRPQGQENSTNYEYIYIFYCQR